MSAVAQPSDTRRLIRSLLLYLVPTALVRGGSIILTPLYTQALPPEEYAVVGVGNTIYAGLTAALGLGVHSALLRLYADCKDHQDRRQLMGAVMLVLATIPVVLVLAMQLLGRAGHLDIVDLVPFKPFGELILWASLASIYSGPLTTLYMAQERPIAFGVFSGATSLAQIGLTVWFVVGLDRGAKGAFEAIFLSQAVAAALSLVLLARQVDLRPGRWARRALVLGLPLVPHVLTNWALSVSDRLILERYVPAADIGRYSLAYLFNLALALVSGAIVQTLNPMVMRRLTANEHDALVPKLGTYAIAAIAWVSVATVAVAPDAVTLLAPPSYSGAETYVTYVVLGAVFQCLYFVWSLGTWYSKRTHWMPALSVAVAAATVGLNLLLVPRYGALAAAVVTAVSYGMLAGAHGALAHWLHPIRWEYSRWLKIAAATGVAYVVVGWASHLDSTSRIGALVAIVLLGWPALLTLLGGVHRDEAAALLQFARRRR